MVCICSSESVFWESNVKMSNQIARENKDCSNVRVWSVAQNHHQVVR